MTATSILFPVGRVVMGSLYEAQTKDAAGQPRIVKTGPRAGQPNPTYFFAVAIPKTPGHTHWSQTPWGQQIWTIGHAAFPQGQAQLASFAWKLGDGDSQVPNKKNHIPAKTEGFPGHWIVYFSSQFAPKIFTADGSAPLAEPGAVKLGHFVEVFGSVDGNNNTQNPGVFMNHNMVAYSGYGPEIVRGPDPTAVGFGKGPAPTGMTTTPPPALRPPPAPAVATPPAPAIPPAAVAIPAAVAPPAPTAVAPHPGILTPPPPPAGPVWKGAPGTTRAQYEAVGWSEAQMRANGLIG